MGTSVSPYSMVRMANEAEEEAKMIMMEEELAKETDALKAGEVFGQQLNFKASAAIAAAAAAAAAAGAAAGLPTIPLKFLRDKGSGAAAVAALNALREVGHQGYWPVSVYRLGEMPIQSCGLSVSAPRGKAGARLNAHTELRAKHQRSAR